MLGGRYLAGLSDLVRLAGLVGHVSLSVQGTLCLFTGAVLVPRSLQWHQTQYIGEHMMGCGAMMHVLCTHVLCELSTRSNQGPT